VEASVGDGEGRGGEKGRERREAAQVSVVDLRGRNVSSTSSSALIVLGLRVWVCPPPKIVVGKPSDSTDGEEE
jgi:hypothetical protein